MNSYGYLFAKMVDLEGEALAVQEGRVEKLRELALLIGGAITPQDAQAKLELERQSLPAPTSADEDYGTPEWGRRQGELEAVALAQAKLEHFIDTVAFTPNYTPPSPQYEERLKETHEN